MKTKTFLLVCLFMGIGLTQLSAQNGKNGNGANTGYFDWSGEQPIYCNGVQIDNLLCSGTVHYTEHWKDGVNIITLCSYDLVYKSTWLDPDEEFKAIPSNEKDFMIPEFVAEWHYNIIGNKGSHYIGTMSQNVVTGKYTIDRAVCLENGPKK